MEDPEKCFRNACADGNLNIVKQMIETKNVVLHPFNYIHIFDDETAFVQACSSGNTKLVNYLLNYGIKTNSKINIHYDNESAFITACQKGYIEIVKLLLEYGEKQKSNIDVHANYDRAFKDACGNGHLQLVKYLLEYFSIIDYNIDNNINSETIIMYNNAFIKSCETGQLHVVKYLLFHCDRINKPLDINMHEDKPFVVACGSNNLELVKYLLEVDSRYNNKINIKKCIVEALTNSSRYGSINTFDFLIKMSDIQIFNNSLLNHLYKNGTIEIIKYLIDFTYRINKKFNIFESESKYYIFKLYYGKNDVEIIKYIFNLCKHLYYFKNYKNELFSVCRTIESRLYYIFSQFTIDYLSVIVHNKDIVYKNNFCIYNNTCKIVMNNVITYIDCGMPTDIYNIEYIIILNL